MTAINVIVQSNAVHVLSDCAGIDTDGALQGLCAKVLAVPHLNLVVTGRSGARISLTLMFDLVTAIAGTWSELRDRICFHGKRHFDEFRPRLSFMDSSVFGPDFDLLIAGLTDAGKPAAYWMVSHDFYAPDVLPWTVTDVGGVSIAPLEPAMRKEFYQQYPPDTLPDALDPACDGLRILQMQRRYPMRYGPTGALYFAAGGAAQLTTVTRECITTRKSFIVGPI